MATRTTQSNRKSSSSSGGSRSTGGRSSSQRSAFNWSSAGTIAGAAAGGAMLAIAANLGRKFIAQSPIATDHWAESLALEHDETLAIFDKMLATDDNQSFKRTMLLGKLAHGLDRHAYSEEHVIYPALRESNEVSDAEHLETDHGEVKEFLFRLKHMATDDPAWIETVREFRIAIEAHARMEEEEIFPRLRESLSEETDKMLTAELAKASFMMA
jgi:hemerythrin superfamily protein